MTFGVPVADGAVTSQFVLFSPALKTVRVTSRGSATVSELQDPTSVVVGATYGHAKVTAGLYTRVPSGLVAVTYMLVFPLA
jgi:hypothetical protein